jgi:outer membrane immunogenic protein
MIRPFCWAVVACAAIAAAPALGADVARLTLPPVVERPLPPPNWHWSGFYVGVNLGYAFENASAPTFAGPSPLIPLLNGLTLEGRRYEAQGPVGGFHLGYSLQFAGRWVAGIETDLMLTGVRRSDQVDQAMGTPISGEFRRSLDYLGTLRGRFGYVAGERFLIYGTAGLAYGQAAFSAVASDGTGQRVSVDRSEMRIGYTIGAGVEFLWTTNLAVRAEYLFYDLGKVHATAEDMIPGAGTANSGEIRSFGNLFRAGISYRF